jgi:hypothetical protein
MKGWRFILSMIIIDRFEADFAVCESGDEIIEIPRVLIPENAKEGDVLMQKGAVYFIDREMTEKRRAEAVKKLKRLGY